MLDPWFKQRYPMKHLKKWLYWPWAEYRVLRDATAVLFTCEEERRLARQSFWLYKCDEFVVNYGTSAPTGDPEAQRALFLERFPHLRGKRCLLFLGRVHEKKGPDLLFRAFAALLGRLPSDQRRDLHLVMAGPDDHAFGREMKALVASLGLSERVTWTGMVSGDLKWGAFHAADAFVLTSHQENFGIAVVEALACGLPVLISSQVNIWREIRQAGAGFVDSDDSAGAERLLDQWICVDSALWQRMRGAARRIFAERFVIDRTAESFIHAMKIHGLRPADTA
jgi:glycosyltransferase involved in cell wall biosynthesis